MIGLIPTHFKMLNLRYNTCLPLFHGRLLIPSFLFNWRHLVYWLSMETWIKLVSYAAQRILTRVLRLNNLDLWFLWRRHESGGCPAFILHYRIINDVLWYWILSILVNIIRYWLRQSSLKIVRWYILQVLCSECVLTMKGLRSKIWIGILW